MRPNALTTAVQGLVSLCMVATSAAQPAAQPTVAAAETWWSLRPLRRPELPSGDHDPAESPIDRFVAAARRAQGLDGSPPADRRTLIRRLYFDLHGLPPSPEEVEAFAEDPNPAAYEALVDRLLASPRYAERQARHWLDVVHYADSHGYDKDKLRPHAWPYRDYVIRAFATDKPYARFVQEQIAGDVLFPGTRDGNEALGFIAAGPWDLIGHEEVPESKVDGKVARHLDRDDMVANTMLTFTSMTAHCAQCHDHKFDPIPQADYYALQAVFAALDRTELRYDADERVGARRRALQSTRASLASRRARLEAELRARGSEQLRAHDAALALAEQAPMRKQAFGYHSALAAQSTDSKHVQVDLGGSFALARVVLHPCHDDFNGIGAGFGFPRRYRVELSDDPTFTRGVRVLADLAAPLANPGIAPQTIWAQGQAGRYLRVVATELMARQNDFNFALAELAAYDLDGRNVALGCAVDALDSIEAPPRWQRSNLTDGAHAGQRDAGDTAALRQAVARALRDLATRDERSELDALAAAQAENSAALAALPEQARVYAGAVHHGSGTFVGTGAQGGAPRPIHLLARGNVQKPATAATPGALSAVPVAARHFALPPDHSEGARRAALAQWLTDPDNPLPWRSIVNRVWQSHFGRGLVDTPNDFGKMGSAPSHPELLDWLAAEFRDGGAAMAKQSLRALHRAIVISATYRQSSAASPQSARDADNRFLWRQQRRKLDAESVRDTVLLLAGKLDLTMFGPGYRDFVVEKPEHSPHYRYDLHDQDDPACHRRAIYRVIVRSQTEPLMHALDCADPSMQVAKRHESVSPLQAVALLDAPLMLRMATHFAARLAREAPDLEAQVALGHRLALGRAPRADEQAALLAYARAHGLANYGRLLFNLGEFHFVD